MSVEKLTAQELAVYDSETVVMVTEANDVVSAFEAEHAALAEEKADAKKKWDDAKDSLAAMIRERNMGRGKRPQKTLLDVLPDDRRGEFVVKLKPHLDPETYSKVLMGAECLGDVSEGLAEHDTTSVTFWGLDAGEIVNVRDAMRKVVTGEVESGAGEDRGWTDGHDGEG